MSELKPCPFCGGEATVDRVDMTGPYDRGIRYEYSPGCYTDECPGQEFGSYYNTREEAIKAWNTRAADATIAKVLEECESWEKEALDLEDQGEDLEANYLRSCANRIKRIIERGE